MRFLISEFIQTLTLTGLAKTKFQGFSGLKKSFSRTFQDTLQIAENEMAASPCKYSKGQRLSNNSTKVFLKSELTQEVTKDNILQ